jgi:hypothetical protein
VVRAVPYSPGHVVYVNSEHIIWFHKGGGKATVVHLSDGFTTVKEDEKDILLTLTKL